MKHQRMCILSVFLLLLVSLAVGETIDLSSSEEVVDWSRSEDLSIDIKMCWGEFILERTEDAKPKLVVETNIWSALNGNGSVIELQFSDLDFDFSKAEGLVEQLGSKEDVYLRVRMSVPTAYVITRVWTTGLFDYYHDASFPEDTNFGSLAASIGKTTSPPEDLKTISASSYPEGMCDDNYKTTETIIIASAAVVGGLVLVVLIGRVIRNAELSRAQDTTPDTVAGTAGEVSQNML